MKLHNDNTATTWWEGEHGDEWEISIHFDYFKAQKGTYDDPAIPAEVEITGFDRHEPVDLDVYDWCEWEGASDSEIDDWAVEIHELLDKQAADDYNTDHSEGTIWSREGRDCG